MYTVIFLWPDNEVEQERKFDYISQAIGYAVEAMRTMPRMVICLIIRPNLPSLRFWWDFRHRLCDNLSQIDEYEGSLAQKPDWRKDGF